LPSVILARALAIAPSGDVLAVGSIENAGTCYDFATAELSRDSGDVRRLDLIDGTSTVRISDPGPCEGGCVPELHDRDEASQVTVAPDGRVTVAGVLSNLRNGRTRYDSVIVSNIGPL
jgi:hypothetical protein